MNSSIRTLNLKKIILYYFFSFLILDLINGIILTIYSDGLPITIGQIIRGILTLLLIYEIIASRYIKDENKYALYFIFLIPFLILLYFFRDGVLKSIPFELAEAIKPLFFLLLLGHIISHHQYYLKYIIKILRFNAIIYSFALILGYITGIGLNAYSVYYEASKSFFYASNATAIIGLSFVIFFTYRLKNQLSDIFYLLLTLISLYISGSMVIIIYPIFLTFFLIYKTVSKNYFKILSTIAIITLLFFFTRGTLNPVLFIQNTLVSRYQERALHSINFFSNHDKIDIVPLRLYSYLSATRAFRAYEGISNIIKNPIDCTIGYGSAMRSKKVGATYAKKFGAEMDFIDIFLTYGIVGFIIIYSPMIKIIFPLIKKFDTNQNAMVIYTIFLYSSLAGHVLIQPMSGTLFALFLGIEKGKV